MESTAQTAHVHGMWAAVAASWDEHADYTDERHAGNAGRLLALIDPGPGERVLELACGAGGVGLAAADLVGPAGEVVLSDVVPEMTAIAATRAAARGLTNVRVRRLDLDAIDEPDGSYDAVVCRDGLQFAFDPAGAVREISRVLRPGGRVALAVWGPRERNPWLGLVLDAVTAQTGRQVPPPGMPGPFALDDPTELGGLLRGAGLTGTAVEELAVPLHATSFDDWWTRTSALAGPLAAMLATLPPAATDGLRTLAERASRPFRTATGLEFPGVALVAAGRRA